MAHQQIRHHIEPDVQYLEECGKLLLTSEEMARFIQLPKPVVQQLVYSDRIPLPLHLGLGKTARWSVFELLEWTEAGCPRRSKWIEARGSSGWCPAYRWGRWWQ
jgi:predicted DNA-binding transcriptional regulator AlpA